MDKNMIDTGIEWIGTIPASWKVERLQWHLDEINEKNNPVKTTNILSLTNKLGVVPYSEKGNQGNVAKENYDEYKVAYPNTIVANSMNILIGSVGYCDYFGCVSPVYYVFKNINGNLKYWNYVFQTQEFQKELRKYANGILEIRLRVSSNDILKRKVMVPSTSEQDSIACFLDKKCNEIDLLIKIIENQIDKLELYRKALITETLSKSANKRIRLKYLGDLQNGINFLTNNNGKKTKFLGVGDFKQNYVLTNEADFSDILINDEIPENSKLQSGDIVFVRSNGSKNLVGNTVLLQGINFEVTFSGFCIRFRKFKNVKFDNKFLLYFFKGNDFRAQLNKDSYGTNINNISQDKLMDLEIPNCSINEQESIVRYLDNKCSSIQKIIEIKKKKIEELQYYKKSIIYEYVTGKKEVI